MIGVNVGIVGLPQTGKKTLFELLAGFGAGAQRSDPTKVVRGIAELQDPRLDAIVGCYRPKKVTRARVEIILPPRIEEKAITQGDIFRDLSEVDVFCHVVRAFHDDAVYHVSGSVDPRRDIDYVNAEFLLHDLVFVEKRLERLGRDLMKQKDERGERERAVLLKLKDSLETELPLRTVMLPDDEEKLIRSYPLLSRREMIVVLNVADNDIANANRLEEFRRIEFVQLAVQVEHEIASLDSEGDRRQFMEELGIEDTALHVLTARCIDALGLISFFTAGPNEVRHWFVRSGATAVEAAGKIHSDLARGFIRAEVIKHDDLVELGGEDKVKAAGRLAVKGRDYVVADGDILFIRFNV